MTAIYVAFDPNAPEGQQLPPEVIEEIKRVAPSAVENGSITTDKIRDDAITTDKYAPGSIDSLAIGHGQIQAPHFATGAVITQAIDDGAVTRAKAGVGVVTCTDTSGNSVERIEVDISATDFAALEEKDPNTYYNVYDD